MGISVSDLLGARAICVGRLVWVNFSFFIVDFRQTVISRFVNFHSVVVGFSVGYKKVKGFKSIMVPRHLHFYLQLWRG